jgi:hypothetical protein
MNDENDQMQQRARNTSHGYRTCTLGASSEYQKGKAVGRPRRTTSSSSTMTVTWSPPNAIISRSTAARTLRVQAWFDRGDLASLEQLQSRRNGPRDRHQLTEAARPKVPRAGILWNLACSITGPVAHAT